MTALNEAIQIDQDLCDGCGLCLPSCAEGALYLADGQVKLDPNRCDGLLHCLGSCPKGALKVASPLEPIKMVPALAEKAAAFKVIEPIPCRSGSFAASSLTPKAKEGSDLGSAAGPSGLVNWPIKLELVSPKSMATTEEFVLAADCVGFAQPDFRAFLGARPLVTGCPKIRGEAYVELLTGLLASRPGSRKIVLVVMTLPCCQGLAWALKEAIKHLSRDDVTVITHQVSPAGDFRLVLREA